MTPDWQQIELSISKVTSIMSSDKLNKLEEKQTDTKWSGKEILGHLVDSAVNNLRRFTEIQFSDSPYQIKPYDQVELVKSNYYQSSDIQEIFSCWRALNNRIIVIIRNSEANFYLPVVLPDATLTDLRFLIQDYIDHMEHHIAQVNKILS